MWNKENTLPLLVGGQTGTTTLVINWWFFRTFRILLPQYPPVPVLDIYPKDISLYHKDTYSTMFIAALHIIARN